MEDIARQSGVSLTTVSLVLRDKPGINDETRQRVLDVARTLGYRKRPQSELLVAPRLRQVGMLNKARPDDQPQTNQFYAPVVAGIEAACRKRADQSALCDCAGRHRQLPPGDAAYASRG